MGLTRAELAARLCDVCIAIGAGFIGYWLYLGAWQGQPNVINLGSDAANIAGFIAATDRPDLFVGDEALGDPHNFAEYMTVQIPSALFLSRFTGGDYGWAFLLPLSVLGALQTLGFYVLGLLMLRSRPLAIGLAASALFIVEVPGLGEYWGAKAHATPREWFQALLPWILSAAWRYRTEPRAWAAVLFVMGLMMYVHPVSAPGWSVALWLGFLICRPQSRSWKRQLGLLLACTVAFFVAALPFVSNYLGEHDHGTTRLPYEQIFGILKYRFADGYMELPKTIVKVTAHWWSLGLIPFALAGGALTWSLKRDDRADLHLLLTWLGGLLLMATLVPVTEHALAARAKMIPVEVDLVRGLRYVVPLLHMLALMGVSAALLRLPMRARTAAAILVTGASLWLLSLTAAPAGALAEGAKRHWNGKEPRKPSTQLKTLLALRDLTPEGSKILPSADHDALPLRFISRRPVVYAWKDGGILGYANHEALVHWFERAKQMKAIAKTSGPKRVDLLVDAARRYGADYLLLDAQISRAQATQHRASVVFSNKRYTLLRVD